MNNLSELLSSAIVHKDDHTIDINRNYSLKCKFSLIVDYEGEKPDAYTNRHFILEESKDDEVKNIVFSKESDISIDLGPEWVDGDIIFVKIKKILSKEEEEVTDDDKKYERVIMTLADARKLLRAAEALRWMGYYMYSGTEAVLKIVEQRMKEKS